MDLGERRKILKFCYDPQQYFSRTVGLRRYKIEDFVPCPDGTFLGVEGKLGDTDM